MLGTSGTVTTIAGIHLRLPRYDRRRVDGCWLADAEITQVIDELVAMSYEERVANACIGSERADLVLAGCAILEAIRRAFPCARLRVADRGLREGMLVKLMREDGVWSGPPLDCGGYGWSGGRGGGGTDPPRSHDFKSLTGPD
jgi:exopolyphosphatase/guanosine-5'-triphosphate,3'-diphosphate pyrophosphatase